MLSRVSSAESIGLLPPITETQQKAKVTTRVIKDLLLRLSLIAYQELTNPDSLSVGRFLTRYSHIDL